jgi:hypothetical protein
MVASPPLILLSLCRMQIPTSANILVTSTLVKMSSNYVNITAPDFNPRVNCTIGTCPIHFAEVQYVPTLVGNALFLAIFSLFLVFQAILAFNFRTWSYNFAMACGLILEVIGYVARIQMHENPFKSNPFVM